MKEVIEHMQSEFENILLDTQKEYRRSNRMKDKIIVVLIVLMFLEAIIGYCGFVWYESQFDYVTTEQTTQDIDLSTEGDNASAEYNDVQGNQYNDNATHNVIRRRKENIVVALQGTENNGIYRRRVRNVRSNS